MIRCIVILTVLVWSALAPGDSVHGQSVIASSALFDVTPPQRRFSEINIHTGSSTPLSPLGPTSYGGLGATSDGRFFGLTGAATGAPISKLYSLDVATNTPTLVGDMIGDPGVSFQSLDVMADGRAYAVSIATITLFPQLFAVNLQTAAITAVNAQRTISDAITAAGGDGFFANVGALGSVGDTLYAIDVRTSSLLTLDPDSGAASVVGGAAGLLLSGELSTGISRSRYTAFTALTGVDANRDGEFDTLLGAVNNFDDDNDPATAGIAIGGVARFDLTTGLWDLIGTNPGIRSASFASVPVPEPHGLVLAMLGLVAMASSATHRRLRGNLEAPCRM